MRQQNISGSAWGIGTSSQNAKRRRGAVALAIAAAAATAVSVPAHAATKQWSASGSGNWSTAASWNSSTVPAATGDTVNVVDNAAGVKTVTFDGAVTTTSMAALTVGGTNNSFTGQMTLLFPAGSTKTVTVTGALTVGGPSTGVNARGVLQQNAATINANGGLNVGTTAFGNYNLAGGIINAANTNIATLTQGTFAQTGGTHAVTGTLSIANDALATGVYSLGPGILNAATANIGNLGFATFNHNDGTHTNSATLNVGLQAGSNGTYNMTTGVLTSANQVWGDSGTATMNQNNGTVNVNGASAAQAFTLAAQSAGVTTYTMNGGAINVTAAGGAVIGKGGNGTLIQNGGTVTLGASRDLLIGSVAGSTGSYLLSSSTLSAGGNVYIGGTSAASGGSGSINIGANSPANVTIAGILKVWNANSTVIFNSGTLTVANMDTGGNPSLFSWSGGTLNITGGGGASIGAGALGSGLSIGPSQALNITGPTTIVSGASFNINGGTFSGSSLSAPANSIAFTAGNFTLTSGGLSIDSASPMGPLVTLPAGSSITVSGAVANGGTVNMGGGSIGGASAMSNAGIITGNGTITGAGGLTNTGRISANGGNLVIAKTGIFQNNTSGVIEVDAGRQIQINGGNLQNNGTLNLDGGGTISSTSGANVINASDGLIIGTGTISAALQNSGTIEIPAGTLNVTNAFASSGIIRFDDNASKLTVGGGGLTNSAGGSIVGLGRITGTLNNSGSVEAIGGVLQLAGTTNNNTGGTLSSGAGTQLFITGTPGANSGMISLAGGTLHTNSQPITNAAFGVISGYGTIRTGGAGLTNNGQVLLSGGSTNVYGAVTSTAGSKIIVSGGSTATFYDPVNMNSGSEFRVSTASNAVFFAPVTGQANFTGAGTKYFEAGGSLITGSIVTSGSTVVQDGASLTAGAIRETALTVNGQVNIAANGTSTGTSRVQSLAIDSDAKLDVSDNKLIVAGGDVGSWNGSAYTGMTGLVDSARASGDWSGNGITTSQPVAASSTLTTLAIATAGEIGRTGTNFGGINVAAGDVLVMYTYGGDANLDGKINIDDYVRIDQGLLNNFTGYSNGDFNLDGKINIDDYTTVIDTNLALQGAPFEMGGSIDAGVTAVPEPSAALLVLGLGLPLRGMRRRRAAK